MVIDQVTARPYTAKYAFWEVITYL